MDKQLCEKCVGLICQHKFTTTDCEECKKVVVTGHSPAYKLCWDCAKDKGLCRQCGKGINEPAPKEKMETPSGIVLEFSKLYRTLNTDLMKEDEFLYDFGILYIHTAEANSGFRVKKINKTNKKGTLVYYKVMSTSEEIDEYKEDMDILISEHMKKHPERISELRGR